MWHRPSWCCYNRAPRALLIGELLHVELSFAHPRAFSLASLLLIATSLLHQKLKNVDETPTPPPRHTIGAITSNNTTTNETSAFYFYFGIFPRATTRRLLFMLRRTSSSRLVTAQSSASRLTSVTAAIATQSSCCYAGFERWVVFTGASYPKKYPSPRIASRPSRVEMDTRERLWRRHKDSYSLQFCCRRLCG